MWHRVMPAAGRVTFYLLGIAMKVDIGHILLSEAT